MAAPPSATMRGAEVVVPCVDFDATLAFFVERLGFRLELILPADAPRTARLSGHGLSVRLERADVVSPVRLRLPPEAACWADAAAQPLDGPGGLRIERAEDDTASRYRPSCWRVRMRTTAGASAAPGCATGT